MFNKAQCEIKLFSFYKDKSKLIFMPENICLAESKDTERTGNRL